jgi:hypothetical protein
MLPAHILALANNVLVLYQIDTPGSDYPIPGLDDLIPAICRYWRVPILHDKSVYKRVKTIVEQYLRSTGYKPGDYVPPKVLHHVNAIVRIRQSPRGVRIPALNDVRITRRVKLLLISMLLERGINVNKDRDVPPRIDAVVRNLLVRNNSYYHDHHGPQPKKRPVERIESESTPAAKRRAKP